MLTVVAAEPPPPVIEDLAIEVYDSPLRFLVRSRTRPEIIHVVELDAYARNGACSCEAFYFGMADRLEEGAAPSDELRCFHIKAVRAKLIDKLIEEIASRPYEWRAAA